MKREINRLFLILPVLTLIFASMNCTINLSSSESTTNQTQTALAVQQTSLALQNSNMSVTMTAQQATLNAPPAAPPTVAPVQGGLPTPDLIATQIAVAAQQTVAAANLVTPVMPIIAQPPEQPTPEPPDPQPPVDLESRMKTASILVYEDIVEDPSEYQYIKKTLTSMGLKFKWDGNAMGWLKSDMLAGGPNGAPWDLVIIAAEWRDEVSGEYFDYLNNVLNAGSSVILEAFYLDDVSEGAISPILAKCGVMVYPYFTAGVNINDAVIWPISGASHPLLQDPHAGMTFTRARDKWFWSFDLGSKMALTGQGDAQLLLGTDAQDPSKDGVLATCMGGQMTLQTFSSHTFPYTVMYPLWENYIYNALKVRFSSGE